MGSQADDVLELAMRGHIISSLIPMMSYVQKTSQGITAGEIDHLIRRDTSPAEYEKVEAMKLLMDDFKWPDSPEMKALFPKEDRLWYLSLNTFALHTYLDVYSRGVIKLITNDEHIKKELELYLEKEASRRTDKSRKPVLTVEEMVQFGVKKRLKALEEGLSLKPILAKLIGNDEIERYWNSFVKFDKIRHKIAHRDPRPNIDTYTFDDFERAIDETELNLDDFGKVFEKTTFMKQAVDMIQDSMIEVFEFIRKTTIVTGMAILYPAFLDSIIAVRLNNHEKN